MAQMPALAGPSAAFWEDIDEQVLGAPAAAVTFSGIDTASFTFFRLTPYVINDANASPIVIQLNNDVGANYDVQRVAANGAAIGAARLVGQVRITLTAISNLLASEDFHAEVLITKPLAGGEAQVVSQQGWPAVAGAPMLELTGAQWNNNADLINRIDINKPANNLDTGTRVLLEGGKPA